MKPIIGLNMDLSGDPLQSQINFKYIEAIKKAGGLPVLIPPMSQRDLKQFLPTLNGIVFIGGHDYSPEIYNEVPAPEVVLINPQREKFDLRLMKAALAQENLPILSICGGMQLLNIVLGGSLIQDIKPAPCSPIQHKRTPGKDRPWHRVRLLPTGCLGEIYQCDRISVVTSHHQAVKTPGAGLQVCAHADDGIIEAIELPGSVFRVGVQWHPEQDFKGSKPLFRAFVRQTRKTLV